MKTPILLALFLLASPWALPVADGREALPPPSERVSLVTGSDLVAVGPGTAILADAEAVSGNAVAPRKDYATVARAALPAEGDPLTVWVRYKGMALQMKTRVDGAVVEFPWKWERHLNGYAWRREGTFDRNQLGAEITFIAAPNFTEEAGIDAVVITADGDWVPGQQEAEDVADLNVPDAANATVRREVVSEEAPASGEVVSVAVDWARPGGAISPSIYSLNVTGGFSPERLSRPNWRRGIDYMHPRQWRFHTTAMTQSWMNEAQTGWNYDAIRQSVSTWKPQPGTEILLNVFPKWPAPLDLDGDSRLDPGQGEAFAALCADLVRFINLDLKANVRYWEVTNEKDFAYWRKPRAGNAPDVAALAAVYNSAAAAMRAVDPSIRIGGPAACSPLPEADLVEFARLTREQLDFFSFHHYATGTGDQSDHAIYEKALIMVDDARSLIGKLRALYGEKPLPEVFLNEFNICYSWRVPEPRMRNHKGAVFDALALTGFARVPGLTGTNAWNDIDGGIYGKLSKEGELRPSAHLYHLLNNYMTGQWVEVKSSQPGRVVPFATVDQEKNIRALLLINRSQAESHVVLRNLGADHCWSAIIDEVGYRVEEQGADFISGEIVLAPHSVQLFRMGGARP